MRVVATLDAPVAPPVLLDAVADLTTYPRWLTIVPRAETLDPVGGAPAWRVDLRARIGPFARAKRLRMVRTVHDEDRVVFERQEVDGRPHGRWRLEAVVASTDAGARLTMTLAYEGRFGFGVLEGLLADEIERSRPRLLSLVTDGGS